MNSTLNADSRLALGAVFLVTLSPSLAAVDWTVLDRANPPAGGAVILHGGDGERQLRTVGALPEAIEPEDVLYEIGSITKVFTGLLLAQAVVQGKVSMDTTIGGILGSEVSFADQRVANITLEELATHTSGLPRLPADLAQGVDVSSPYAHYDAGRLVAFLHSHQLADPDDEGNFPADYSNLGVGLLGYLLGERLEADFPAAMQSMILEPLGMSDTYVTRPAAVESRIAPPHAGADKVAPWIFSALAGAGSIYSTAADMEKFAAAILNPDGSPLSAAIQLMREPRAPFSGDRIGLGLMQGRVYGKARLFHDGETGGYSASMQLTPESGSYLIILANQGQGYATRLANQILGAGQSQAIAANEEGEADGAFTTPLERFTGSYRLNPQATFIVHPHEDVLYLRLTGQTALPTERTGERQFVNRQVGAVIEFEPDGQGSIQHLVLNQSGRELPAERIQGAPVTPLLLPEGSAESYAGEYELAPGAVVTISAHQRQLIAQLTGQGPVPLLPDGPDRFAYDIVEAEISFQRTEAGEISGLTLHQNGRDMPAPRIGG